MSPEEIARLRELAAKATPGPWLTVDGPPCEVPYPEQVNGVSYGKTSCGDATVWAKRNHSHRILATTYAEDAAYIAAAANAVPELCREVEELRAINAGWKDLVRDNEAARARIARLEEALREVIGSIRSHRERNSFLLTEFDLSTIERAALATEGGG